MKAVTYEELSVMADKAGVPVTLVNNTARETTQRFHETWQAEKNNIGLTAHMRDTIDSHYAGTALLTDS